MCESDLKRRVDYYRRQLDSVAGENLRKDYEISGLRKAIQHRQRAFALLSKLQAEIGVHQDVGEILRTVMTSITASLGMDRTIIFKPGDAEHEFRPWMWTGFSEEGRLEEFEHRLSNLVLSMPELRSRSDSLLANREATSTPSIEALRSSLETPFFVAVPIVVDDRPIALLLSGRVKETTLVFTPLTESDAETFRAIASLVSAVIQNQRFAVLEESNRLKTDFFANISHEFRTPITLSLGPISGLLRHRYGFVPPAACDQLRTMEANQRRLLRLVNQLLDVAKAESGAMQLRCSPVPSFNQLVGSRVDHFRGLADKRGIELSCSLSPEVDERSVCVDLEKFDRIVLNLLSNAHKFTGKGGRIEVATRAGADAVQVSVSDTGLGIAPEQLPHIFDRFRQADGSRSREYAGTGIGLALVKEFIELHHGSVRVNSTVGRGTTFELTWPTGTAHLADDELVEWAPEETDTPVLSEVALAVDEGAEGAEPSEVEHVNREARNAHDDDKPTILFVDDNRQLRSYVRDLLVDRHNVYLAADGEQGLALARRLHPDLVLSDLMMPKLNGAQLCSAIREDAELRATPFVMLTAKASVDDRTAGLEDGVDDYLSKPFSERELRARISNLIRLRGHEVRLTREIAAAQRIQAGLLPAMPHALGPIVLDALYRPSSELSGDFFDLLQSEDSTAWFFVADVTSHGAAAAQVTMLVKSLAREVVEHVRPASVAEFVGALQRRYATLGLPYDVGLQAAQLHLDTAVVDLVRGNAPTPLLRTANGKIRPAIVQCGSGLTARASGRTQEYASTRIALQPGDSLLLFTDGAVELPAGARRFGIRRLSRVLSEVPLDAEWSRGVERRLVAAAGTDEFGDDLTIARITREPGS